MASRPPSPEPSRCFSIPRVARSTTGSSAPGSSGTEPRRRAAITGASLDAFVLDRLLDEITPVLRGRALRRSRGVGAHAVAIEIGGEGNRYLWFEASRSRVGLYLVERSALRRLSDEGEASGRTRQAVLLLRKHLEGRPVAVVRRVRGERTVVIEAGPVALVFRLSGAPAATLVVDGAPVSTFGEGREAWPLPEADAQREASWSTPDERRPSVRIGGPLGSRHDADLAAPGAVALGPAAVGVVADIVQTPTWAEAAALFLEARARGARFERRRKTILGGARKETRRLERLEAHLASDLAGLPAAETLRRSGEALLAAPGAAPPGAAETEVPDPYEPTRLLRVALDPRLSLPANADRLFEKARRIDRGRRHVEARLAETGAALAVARGQESRAQDARDLADFEPAPAARPGDSEGPGSGPRHYLTSHGLSILVGRGAKENHHLTFAVARPEDLWLHVRDAPGAHVVVRDNEGRAGAEDIREAAEVAAFFSDAKEDPRVDVHVTRRKHVRPSRGGPGRVKVAHSETVRIAPRDPEGRLRRR